MSGNVEKHPPLRTVHRDRNTFHFSVSEPKITAAPMCGLWYENNQFACNEIKVKGRFEQKQIYCDRLSSSGNLKAVVAAAWKRHQAVSSEGKETNPDFSDYAAGMKKNWKPRQPAKATSISSLLSFSGVASDWHNQTAERPSVWQTGIRKHTSLSRGDSHM